MLATLADARERIAVRLGLALLLWLLGRGGGALVRRRSLKLQRPSFAHVMGRVVVLALSLRALVALTVIFPGSFRRSSRFQHPLLPRARASRCVRNAGAGPLSQP